MDSATANDGRRALIIAAVLLVVLLAVAPATLALVSNVHGMDRELLDFYAPKTQAKLDAAVQMLRDITLGNCPGLCNYTRSP